MKLPITRLYTIYPAIQRESDESVISMNVYLYSPTSVDSTTQQEYECD